jgi:nitrogen fixation protein FixH
MMERELTGRHVAAIFVGAFGVIIGVNLLLAWKAVSTFPGIEVANGYVASQSFDTERKAQIALGWIADTRLDGETLRVSFTKDGAPADVASVEGLFGRATEAIDDQTPVFTRVSNAIFEAPVKVARGEWILQLRAQAPDGTGFRQRVSVTVR